MNRGISSITITRISYEYCRVSIIPAGSPDLIHRWYKTKASSSMTFGNDGTCVTWHWSFSFRLLKWCLRSLLVAVGFHGRLFQIHWMQCPAASEISVWKSWFQVFQENPWQSMRIHVPYTISTFWIHVPYTSLYHFENYIYTQQACEPLQSSFRCPIWWRQHSLAALRWLEAT